MIMSLKIILINPNKMKKPPVIPIGLEYLITALEKNGYEVDLLDLCFAPSPIEELEKKLDDNQYDIAGFTIRNIDSCIYFNNEFYLHKIKELIQCVKKYKVDVVLGGAGFSAAPNEVLEYLKADYGIIGPGEIIFPRFLEMWKSKKLTKQIYDGWKFGPNIELIHLRGDNIDYSRYFSENGVVGFETHVGCQNQCPYCIEAKKRVKLKNIPNIIEEIKYIVDKGYAHFHLCDSEFNDDLNFSIEFCKALIDSKIPLKWALYMKPTPYSEDLFRLLSKSNAYLITLTVDSDERIQTLNKYTYDDLIKIIEYCNKYDIRLAIDLLTGYPNEPLESTKKVIDFFKTHRPTKVGVSFYYRLLNNTPLTNLIRKDNHLQKKLTMPYEKEDDFLKPNFYSQYTQEKIVELIGDDDLFSIAGITPGVNYEKVL